MPFWVSTFFRILGHTRQISGGILLMLLLYTPLILSPFLPSLLQSIITLFYLLIGLSMLALLIPNPHNRDDNTSGVIGLLALAHCLKDQPHLRSQVQFAFLDNEEWGLLGSSALKQQWDKTGHPYQEAAVINLDCISRGRIPLLVHHNNDTIAQRLAPHLQKQFPQTKLLNLGILPLSDNYTFKKTGAIDTSFADPSTIPGGYHIPRIHTPADNDFNPHQVTHLIECLTEFLANELEMETP